MILWLAKGLLGLGINCFPLRDTKSEISSHYGCQTYTTVQGQSGQRKKRECFMFKLESSHKKKK